MERPDKYTAGVNFAESFTHYLVYSAHDGTRIQPREIFDQSKPGAPTGSASPTR